MEILLRDGSRTSDPRLNRLIEFDEESRAYPVSRLLTAEQQRKPRSYTWGCDLWLDQGQEGKCVGCALTLELAARPFRVRGLNIEFASALYYQAQRIDPWPGGEYEGASPRYSGTSVLSGIKTVQDKGYYQSYSWAFSEEELMLAIGYKGPAVLGIPWYDSMYETDSKGFISPSGSVVGGHAILCNGFSVRQQVYRLRNSWGIEFGINGDCFVTRDDMKTLLDRDGECVIPEFRSLGAST